MLSCEFNGRKFKCPTEFSVIVTDYGFCCSFNSLEIREELQPNHIHTHDDIHVDEDSTDVCPKTALETGEFEPFCDKYLGMYQSCSVCYVQLHLKNCNFSLGRETCSLGHETLKISDRLAKNQS